MNISIEHRFAADRDTDKERELTIKWVWSLKPKQLLKQIGGAEIFQTRIKKSFVVRRLVWTS